MKKLKTIEQRVAKAKKLPATKVLIYLENGRVWPTIKVCNHDNIEVIVVNNDLTTIWKPKIQFECDKEISEASELVDELKEHITVLGERIKE